MASGTQAEGFDDFYRRTAQSVVHLIYATTGDLTLAQDCTQEAYARAWSRWRTVGRYEQPLSWVRTVARRLATSAWRHEQAGVRATRLAQASTTPTPPPSEDRVAILRALAQLAPVHREAIALHYLADLSIEQIATETGRPIGTVKAHLHRGRTHLAELLRSTPDITSDNTKKVTS